MQNQKTAKNNGHYTKIENNGNGRRTEYANLKIKVNIAMAFKQGAVASGKDQSEFLAELLKSAYFKDLFENPQFKETMTNLVDYINKRAKEPPINFKW